MYIWIGIDVDDQLGEIKNKALNIDKEINFKNSCFTLPLHISLKTAFQIDKSLFEKVIATINDYYLSIRPFEICIDKLEKYDNIIWIRMHRNEELDKIHDDLNNILKDEFNISLHEYDLDYKYHTTLFMDDNYNDINEAYSLIKDEKLPSKIIANQFLIGISESGELGTYSVYKKIRRNN